MLQQFRTLVESLLERNLAEIGVSGEQFVAACERARNTRDINKMVFDQIMAVDDFLSPLQRPAALPCVCSRSRMLLLSVQKVDAAEEHGAGVGSREVCHVKARAAIRCSHADIRRGGLTGPCNKPVACPLNQVARKRKGPREIMTWMCVRCAPHHTPHALHVDCGCGVLS